MLAGVNTRKPAHVAVAITRLGAVEACAVEACAVEACAVEACAVEACAVEACAVEACAVEACAVEACAVEGTGSYSACLAGFLRRQAIRVAKVGHCNRRMRRKHNTLDAESAARSLLAGVSSRVIFPTS